MNTKWKRVYQTKDKQFEIQKRMSRNVIEDKAIEANDIVKFVFTDNSGVGWAFEVDKDILLKAVCTPLMYKPIIYYALRCEQNNHLMHTGLNTTSKESLRKELLSYISIDFDANDEDWARMEKMNVDEIASMWEFTILENDERFEKE